MCVAPLESDVVNADQPPPLLRLDHLTFRYGTTTVVDDVSLALAAGEIGCLLGPSGCGKTTLLRLIAGFEAPAAGSVVMDGAQVSSPAGVVPPEARRMGMVFQDFALFPHLTVADNIAFGLRGTRAAERRARVEALLALTGLGGLGARFPHELSGGQQQRVALARALAPRPRLVLLDEPFSSLDVTLRERLAAEVRGILLEEKLSAILVTHDQHEAFAFADRIGVVRAGRLEQWANAYDLYHRPNTRFVAEFIGEGAFLPAVVGPDGIATALGPMQGELTGPGKHAHEVELLLRPDDVVHDDAAACKAEVIARAFRGAEFLYTLELPDGHRVQALVPSHHDHPPGSRIGIRLDTEHLVAFPAR
jgi:iron(III) transport system ATP-binding protein